MLNNFYFAVIVMCGAILLCTLWVIIVYQCVGKYSMDDIEIIFHDVISNKNKNLFSFIF